MIGASTAASVKEAITDLTIRRQGWKLTPQSLRHGGAETFGFEPWQGAASMAAQAKTFADCEWSGRSLQK